MANPTIPLPRFSSLDSRHDFVAPARKPASARAAARRRAIAPIHQALVHCADEADQRRVYEAMAAEGRSCRLLTL